MTSLLTEKQAAEFLTVSLSTVRKLRATDPTFPPVIRITNDLIRFDGDALKAWLDSRAKSAA